MTMAGSNESDDVMDSLSTVLYNMTCRESNLDPMLQDAYYVNTMIRIMRKGEHLIHTYIHTYIHDILYRSTYL